MQNQKLIIDIEGKSLLDSERGFLRHSIVAGIILFARNYESKKQITELIKEIRKAANKELLIVVDNESEKLWRFSNDEFSTIKPAEYFGVLYDINSKRALNEAYNAGFTMASEQLAVGVDMSLVPVLDLMLSDNLIKQKQRAFHSNANIVTELAESFIDGMKKAGMPACGKHFPGHGFTKSDTHFNFAEDARDFDVIEKNDLLPYKKLVKKLDYILASLVTYSRVDSRPSSYSKHWLQCVLRKKLEFTGKIISDCLSMKAASLKNNTQKVKTAWSAGCDLVIFSQLTREDLSSLLVDVSF